MKNFNDGIYFQPPSLLKEPPKLEQLDINISSLLPAITPNYRPLGNLTDNIHQRSKVLLDDEALSKVMSSKNQRYKCRALQLPK